MSRYQITLFLTVSAFAMQAQEAAPSDSLVNELREVVVTANQPATRLEGSTLVTTVVGSPLQNLGTALDVLPRLPLVTVNEETVSVVGRGEPEIYIDGRPLRDGAELRELQSDNIRKIELVMAPGAAYGSDVSSVLRITTRHRFLDGLSLTERAEGKLSRKLSGNEMLELNYRTGAWDIFASGTIARNNSLTKGSTINTLDDDGRTVTVGSTNRNAYPANTGTLKAGFNYGREGLSFGAYWRFNPERADYTNHGSEWMDGEEPLARDISRDIQARSHLVSAYADATVGGGYHLHFDGDWRVSRSSTDASTTYPGGTVADVNSSDLRHTSLWAGKMTLDFPLWHGHFTAGTQDSYTRTSLDYRMLNAGVGEYIPSSQTLARQTALAAFASWERGFGPFGLRAGLRYEYVDYRFDADGKRDNDVSRRDHLLTPDVSLSYNPREEAGVTLSYRMSTVRPPYSQLTGSLTYTGRHEIEGGNPRLRDERMHHLQLTGVWRDFILQGDLTRNLDTYAFVKRRYPAPTLQLLMQPVNIDVTHLDLWLVWSRRIGSWTPNLTAGLHRQWLGLGAQRYDRPTFSYYAENMFTLPWGLTLTADAHGNSGGDMHTNRFAASWFTLDAALVKTFLDRSLRVRLAATDIFNTSRSDWSMNTCGVYVDKLQSPDNRAVTLTITYTLRPRQSRYKGTSASQSELQRL